MTIRHDFSGDAEVMAARLLGWCDDLAIPKGKCEIKLDGDAPDDPDSADTTVVLTLGDGAEVIIITFFQDLEEQEEGDDQPPIFLGWSMSGTLITTSQGDQDLGDGPADHQTFGQFMAQASLYLLAYLEDLDIDDDGGDEPEPDQPPPPPKEVPAKRVDSKKSKAKKEKEPAGV
jgi:hypothetical protein